MPFLDANALETDPDGLAFLHSVLGGVPRGRSAAQKANMDIRGPAASTTKAVLSLLHLWFLQEIIVTERNLSSKKALLTAEEQLVFGSRISEVMAARDELRVTDPDCLLLQLVDAKLARMLLATETVLTSPWAV